MRTLAAISSFVRIGKDGALVVALSAAYAVALGSSANAQPIFRQGHADIGVAYEDGELELHYHFGDTALAEGGETIAESEFAPSGVFTRVPDPSIPRSAGAQWDFQGTANGSPLWTLPQTFNANKPFLGIASEELEPSDWSGPITFSLTGVLAAPLGGQFSLWQTDLLNNPTRLWDTQDSDLADDFFDTLVGGHDHASFGFTAPGVYQLEFTASGQHVTDGFVSGSGVFTFLVGDATASPEATAVPEPQSLGAMLITAAVLALGYAWRRRRLA